MTDKRAYYNLCMAQPMDWLASSAMAPSPFMRPIHVKIIRIVMRKKV